jgi:hypothetical protein
MFYRSRLRIRAGFRVLSLGACVYVSKLKVLGLGFSISGFGVEDFRVQGIGSEVLGIGFHYHDSGFIKGSEHRVQSV